MIYLILYDITSDTLRQRVSKRLVSEGYERIQLSAFLGTDNPKTSAKLWCDIGQWLATEPAAKFYVIQITESNLRELMVIGEMDLDIEMLLGTRNSLFF